MSDATQGKPEGDETGPANTVELHHRVQLGLVRAVEVLLAPGGDTGAASETVARLLDFTRVHFSGEETLMRLHGYPGADAHAAAHATLLSEAVAIGHAHGLGEPSRAAEACVRLRAWLVEHIDGMDAAFDGWCTRTGVQLE
jgi:hemerythrin